MKVCGCDVGKNWGSAEGDSSRLGSGMSVGGRRRKKRGTKKRRAIRDSGGKNHGRDPSKQERQGSWCAPTAKGKLLGEAGRGGKGRVSNAWFGRLLHSRVRAIASLFSLLSTSTPQLKHLEVMCVRLLVPGCDAPRYARSRIGFGSMPKKQSLMRGRRRPGQARCGTKRSADGRYLKVRSRWPVGSFSVRQPL